jgi:hypothetical protein
MSCRAFYKPGSACAVASTLQPSADLETALREVADTVEEDTTGHALPADPSSLGKPAGLSDVSGDEDDENAHVDDDDDDDDADDDDADDGEEVDENWGQWE